MAVFLTLPALWHTIKLSDISPLARLALRALDHMWSTRCPISSSAAAWLTWIRLSTT
jgi:hypothetical protein